MIPNPIRKVLSTFQSCEVRALLMGGQACVFYGGAEFNRDTDFAILADEENLVAAKKTQRDKDWPMIRRLLEADLAAAQAGGMPYSDAQVRFWLAESRTPEALGDLCQSYPQAAREISVLRPILGYADDPALLEQGLLEEEQAERRADREYWLPLRKELEELRRSRATLA